MTDDSDNSMVALLTFFDREQRREVLQVCFFQATEPRRSRKYPDLNQLEAELETAREEKLRARKKRKLEATTVENNAKKLKLEEKATPDGNKKRKGGRRTLPKKDSSKSADDSDDGEEEQEDCSAKPKCLKPVGKEVIILLFTYSATNEYFFINDQEM